MLTSSGAIPLQCLEAETRNKARVSLLVLGAEQFGAQVAGVTDAMESGDNSLQGDHALTGGMRSASFRSSRGIDPGTS